MTTTPKDQPARRREPHPDEKLENAGVLSNPTPTPSRLAWEALGLAEFPIVTTAVKRPAVDTLDFSETTTRRGKTLDRRWSMVASSEYGLPRLYDLDLYVALLVLAERHGYETRLIKTTMHELCTIPGLTPGGTTYARIRQGTRRFIHTGYSARGVFWPDKAKEPISVEEWHILAEARLLPTYQDPAIQDGLPPSYILLGEKFLNITKREQRKPINLGLWGQLGTGLAKPLFHYLDTALYNRDRFEIGMNRLADHIGQTTRYAPSHMKRLYRPYLERFVDLGFIHSFSFEKARSKHDPCKVIVFPGENARRSTGRAVPVHRQPKDPNAPSEGRTGRNSGSSDSSSTPRQLAIRFQELRHGAEDHKPTRGQVGKMAELLRQCGGDEEHARLTVSIGAQLGRETENPQGYPSHAGGLLEGPFIELARQRLEQHQEEQERSAQQERDAELRAEFETAMEQRGEDRLQALSADEREATIEAGLPRYHKEFEWYIRRQGWDRARAREWAEPRILKDYAKEGRPRYDEWLKTRSA